MHRGQLGKIVIGDRTGLDGAPTLPASVPKARLVSESHYFLL